MPHIIIIIQNKNHSNNILIHSVTNNWNENVVYSKAVSEARNICGSLYEADTAPTFAFAVSFPVGYDSPL